jgi:hypothetical protein
MSCCLPSGQRAQWLRSIPNLILPAHQYPTGIDPRAQAWALGSKKTERCGSRPRRVPLPAECSKGRLATPLFASNLLALSCPYRRTLRNAEGKSFCRARAVLEPAGSRCRCRPGISLQLRLTLLTSSCVRLWGRITRVDYLHFYKILQSIARSNLEQQG